MENKNKIYLYDTLMRDGAQTQGINFSLNDKFELTQDIDNLGLDYIEAGFVGSNKTDDAYFNNIPKLKNSEIVAFGMTKRAGVNIEDDLAIKNLVKCKAKNICIVGKSWDFHVKEALNISLEENLEIVTETISHLKSKGKQVFFDAEHFFDGYKNNPKYAMKVIKSAYNAGARWVILCDTNGGTLPFEVYDITKKVTSEIAGSFIGIHCHNDTENAVANSLEAVRAGARQVQGTINGYGERCGNANLISIIPTLKYKMGYEISVSDSQLKKLKKISDSLEERLNQTHYKHAAYVGDSAFAHKGGIHASAVNKNTNAYEHISPEIIGNKRVIVISDQAGRSNISARLKDLKIPADKDKIEKLFNEVKKRESAGFSYDFADASFEVLAHQITEDIPEYFAVKSFRIIDERKTNNSGDFENYVEATIKLSIQGKIYNEIAEAKGPVDALYKAIRKALRKKYPIVKDVSLSDYKVRIMKNELGTEAITRVQIESKDSLGNRWNTIGVSGNILDASFNALCDSFMYKIIRSK
ncbi:MAG: citramalate synthase [Rickettsiales bacterium]|nr:citramalate synthase [Rickettsiales bacterium]